MLKDGDKCLLSLDWGRIWKDLDEKTPAHPPAGADMRKLIEKRIRLQELVEKDINNTINTIINNYSISNTTKLVVIKEIYLKELDIDKKIYKIADSISATNNAIKNIRHVCKDISLEEAETLVKQWSSK